MSFVLYESVFFYLIIYYLSCVVIFSFYFDEFFINSFFYSFKTISLNLVCTTMISHYFYIIILLSLFIILDFGSQLDNFTVYINDTNRTPFYNSTGVPFTDGIYEIILEPEVLASSIIVTRQTGRYITLCEVEAFARESFNEAICDSIILQIY